MNTLQSLIKTIENKNDSLQGLYGLSSLQGLAYALEEQQKAQIAISGISGLIDIAKQISQQIKPIDITARSVAGNLALLVAIKPPKQYSALLSLTSTLTDIAKTNQVLSDSLSSLAANQLILSNNLSEIAKSIDYSHLNEFNSIEISLQGVSKLYLRSINKTQSWDEINIVDEATEKIANLTGELLTSNPTVTGEDLYSLKVSIITELNVLLTKTKTEKAKQFVRDIMTIVAFLFCFYNPFEIKTDKSNTEIITEIKTQLDKTKKGLSFQIHQELQKFSKTKVARANIKLRKYPKKNTEIIGIVKSGQRATILEIRHKFLLIVFIDIETNQTKSGFVMKKYFTSEN